jgi:hypothetical protein
MSSRQELRRLEDALVEARDSLKTQISQASPFQRKAIKVQLAALRSELLTVRRSLALVPPSREGEAGEAK